MGLSDSPRHVTSTGPRDRKVCCGWNVYLAPRHSQQGSCSNLTTPRDVKPGLDPEGGWAWGRREALPQVWVGFSVVKLHQRLGKATETWPAGQSGGGGRRRAPTLDRRLAGGQKRLRLATGTQGLSPHLAAHSLAKHGHVTSPFGAFFLISNSEAMEPSPTGASSSDFLMI